MADDWRATVTFSDAAHAEKAVQSVREHEIDDVRSRLGRRVAVSADGPNVFLSAATEDTAREADRVVRELLAKHQLTAEFALDRWHPLEEDWVDASAPLPETAVIRQAPGLAPSQSATAGRSLVPAMREPPDDTGLAYPETADDAAANATRLSQVDLADPTELTRGRVDPARWNDVSLRWLVDPVSCGRAVAGLRRPPRQPSVVSGATHTLK